jgi:hypothetical protein
MKMIIFSPNIAHSVVASKFLSKNSKVTSAGFFHIKDGEPICYGVSDSLGIASKPKDDAELFKIMVS